MSAVSSLALRPAFTDGLKPREPLRSLSASFEEAEAAARQRDPAPAVIIVDARAAQHDNIDFYLSGPLFLAEIVPPQFLSLKK